MSNNKQETDLSVAKTIMCIVAGTCANGEPDFYFTKITGSEKDIEFGRHLEVAQQAALEHGYEGPFVVFDQDGSAGKALLTNFGWDSANNYLINS